MRAIIEVGCDSVICGWGKLLFDAFSWPLHMSKCRYLNRFPNRLEGHFTSKDFLQCCRNYDIISDISMSTKVDVMSNMMPTIFSYLLTKPPLSKLDHNLQTQIKAILDKFMHISLAKGWLMVDGLVVDGG